MVGHLRWPSGAAGTGFICARAIPMTGAVGSVSRNDSSLLRIILRWRGLAPVTLVKRVSSWPTSASIRFIMSASSSTPSSSNAAAKRSPYPCFTLLLSHAAIGNGASIARQAVNQSPERNYSAAARRARARTRVRAVVAIRTGLVAVRFAPMLVHGFLVLSSSSNDTDLFTLTYPLQKLTLLEYFT